MTEARIETGVSSAGALPALELHWGPACTLHPGVALAGACDAGDWEAASRINAEVAREFAFDERGVAQLRGWCLLRIREAWGDDITARETWANVVREQGEKLAGLGARLAGARPKIEEAKGKLAGLSEGLTRAKPEPELEPEVEEEDLFATLKLKAGVVERPRVAAEPEVEPKAEEAEPEVEREVEVELPLIELPGVAGLVQQHYLETSPQPSRALSLMVGLMVPTALLCDKVIGPSGGPHGCSIQQYSAGLAPTTGGKQWAIDEIKRDICAANPGAKGLIGPSRFKSGIAVVKHVKDNRISICVQDEFGAVFKRLKDPRANPCEQEIMERLREFWSQGPESIVTTPRGASELSEVIENPRLNLALFAVIDEFFEGCEGPDVQNGTLNRLVIFKEPRLIPMRRGIKAEKLLPFRLQNGLEKLYGMKRKELGWTSAAEELYWAEVDRLYLETNDRRRKLFGRTPEKISKAATTFAAGIGLHPVRLTPA
jgi:hypothetical protein